MDKKIIYVLIAVVAVAIIAGVAVAAIGNNDNPSESAEKTITYHGNGGVTSEEAEQVTKTSSTIPSIFWTRDYYHTVGYTASSDGSGTVYQYGESVPNVKDLYVKWEKNTKTTVNITSLPSDIKVTCNGNVVNPGDVLTTDDDCELVIKIENTVSGKYTFVSSGITFSTMYLVKNGEKTVYSISRVCEGYNGGGPSGCINSREDENHTLVYTIENMKTFTLEFGYYE